MLCLEGRKWDIYSFPRQNMLQAGELRPLSLIEAWPFRSLRLEKAKHWFTARQWTQEMDVYTEPGRNTGSYTPRGWTRKDSGALSSRLWPSTVIISTFLFQGELWFVSAKWCWILLLNIPRKPKCKIHQELESVTRFLIFDGKYRLLFTLRCAGRSSSFMRSHYG